MKNLLAILSILLIISCSNKTSPSKPTDPKVLSKINFDLSTFDKDGLYGKDDGKRAMDYEFCVPNKATLIEQVKAIDPSLKVHQTAKGRIGCSSKEVMCIGNTHQKRFKEILITLASLEFIKRIEPTYFE